jgi:two-component system, OmpR family, copper resistance phosphate regulon response regulator CusR
VTPQVRERPRCLVVEDERKVAAALAEGLESEGFALTVENGGDRALSRLLSDDFDVVLLDLTLPERDGFELLAALRRRGTDTRVLVMTARDALEDRLCSLDGGADDYLIKPFAFEELLARMRALLRRGRVTESSHLVVGDLRMDLDARRVTRGGRPVDLTLREFELLEYLMRRARQVVPRDASGRDVWQETSRFTTLDNVIDVHVARLRRKIDAPGGIKLLWTMRGVGFVIDEEKP